MLKIPKTTLLFLLPVLTAALVTPHAAFGHGFAGKRFFPATLSTDDPFVSDELSLPTISTIVTPDGGGMRDTELSVEISKRITPNLDIEAGERFIILDPQSERSVNGFGNVELGAKYEFFENDEHETVFSLGVGVEIGGAGSKSVGADTFSTWQPAFFFGKGLGDLPDGLWLLRPLAVTGLIGVAFPTSARTRTFSVNEETGASEPDIERHPNVLQYGFAIEYSLTYLQQNVKDVGLRTPLDHLIPLVEFAFETPLDRGQRGQTTGTINPGIIWFGKFCQLGVEVVIPVNSRSGSDVGVIAQLHFYLDDLFPHSVGRPLFGRGK